MDLARILPSQKLLHRRRKQQRAAMVTPSGRPKRRTLGSREVPTKRPEKRVARKEIAKLPRESSMLCLLPRHQRGCQFLSTIPNSSPTPARQVVLLMPLTSYLERGTMRRGTNQGIVAGTQMKNVSRLQK